MSFGFPQEREPAACAGCPRATAPQTAGLSYCCVDACAGVRPSGHAGGGRREPYGVPIAAGAPCPARHIAGVLQYPGWGSGAGAGHRGPAVPGSPRELSRAGLDGSGHPGRRGCGLCP